MKHKFKVGDRVRIKKSVTEPYHGWGGGVSHESIGVLKKVPSFPFGASPYYIEICFPEHRNGGSHWMGLLSEIEPAQRRYKVKI